jgi:phosphoserine aminotransferase
MNLLTPGSTADYIITGDWAKKALKEAKKVGSTHVSATTEEGNFRRIPIQSELKLTSGAAYVHMTSNNTIHGTEWHTLPDVGGVPLVCDASSDIFSRPIDIARYGLIYAGAQKNLGPSGVTLVIIREDLLARSADSLPSMLNYKVQAENNSLYNTPPVFSIYILRLVLKWLRAQGGLEAIEKVNIRKAETLYAELDRTGYWTPHADKGSRSRMNVTFRLPNEDVEKIFVKESTAAGFDGLKGHRSVGGMRASIYNAFPEQGIKDLVSFMKEFERKHG